MEIYCNYYWFIFHQNYKSYIWKCWFVSLDSLLKMHVGIVFLYNCNIKSRQKKENHAISGWWIVHWKTSAKEEAAVESSVASSYKITSNRVLLCNTFKTLTSFLHSNNRFPIRQFYNYFMFLLCMLGIKIDQ